MRTFLLSLVCQHRTECNIPNTLDALHASVELVVDNDTALVVNLNTNSLEVEAFGVRATTNGNENNVSVDLR